MNIFKLLKLLFRRRKTIAKIKEPITKIINELDEHAAYHRQELEVSEAAARAAQERASIALAEAEAAQKEKERFEAIFA